MYEDQKEITTNCVRGQNCPFYVCMNNMINLFKQPMLFIPIHLPFYHKRGTDIKMQTIQDFEELLYGGHECDPKKIRTKEFDKEVFDKIISSGDINGQGTVYQLCYYNWFRSFFSMSIKPMMSLIKFKDPIIIINSIDDIDRVSYPSYFKGKDHFMIFKGEDDTHYDEIISEPYIKKKYYFKNSDEVIQQEYFTYVSQIMTFEERLVAYKSYDEESSTCSAMGE